MPSGYISFGEHYDYNLVKLEDANNYYSSEYAQIGWKVRNNNKLPALDRQYCKDNQIFDTYEQAVEYLKSLIIERLREEGYRNRKDKQIHNQHKKVWHT